MAAIATRPADRGQTHHKFIDIPILQAPNAGRKSAAFSPVNELGSFEFDRVLKSDSVLKRRKRTNSWDTVRLVLRPNLLSIYRDKQETRLKHQVNMSEVTAVALRKDSKRKGDHGGVFGIFSPSRNFHLEAGSEREAKAWVEVLRREARIDQTAGSTFASTSGGSGTPSGLGRMSYSAGRSSMASMRIFRPVSADLSSSRLSTSLTTHHDTEPVFAPPRPIPGDGTNLSSSVGSFSDSAEEAMFGSMRDMSLNSRCLPQGLAASSPQPDSMLQNADQAGIPGTRHGAPSKHFYMINGPQVEERIVWNGYMQCLKMMRGVRQWRRYWTVLRAKHLALYKTDEEYAVTLILPLSTILDAVETDPVAKGKDCCMQIITEERSYRFCCADEEDLSRWIGAIKSTLALRKKKTDGGEQAP